MSKQINIFFDENFEVDIERLQKFLEKDCRSLNFNVSKERISSDFDYFDAHDSHEYLFDKLSDSDKEALLSFYFSEKQYTNNFFFITYENLVPVSFYSWEYFTPLPYSNGILYFIIELIALQFNVVGLRHVENNTGCIYDYKIDKSGIDDCMRQASFCLNCLNKLENELINQSDLDILEDLKVLMNHLSNASKWNKDILELNNNNNNSNHSINISKRKIIKEGHMNILIASPGDLIEERELILHNLERKFRVDKNEELTKHRLIVHGWEDLASQTGYPQDVINEKVLKKVDIVIAVFKHKLGTPTYDQYGNKRSESGTAEEILYALDNKDAEHPLGMVYFYSKAPSVSLDTDFTKIVNEWNRLVEFKKQLRNKVIFKPYTDKTELLEKISSDLVKNIFEYF